MMSWTGRIAAITAFITGFSVIVSVIYNFSYFRILDKNMFSIMSFNDYIIATLGVIPYTLLGIAIGHLAGTQIFAGFEVNADDISPEAETRRKRHKKFGNYIIGFMYGISIGGILSIIFLMDNILVQTITVMCLWLIISRFLVVMKNFSEGQRLFVSVCVILLISTFFLGKAIALSDLRAQTGDYRIETITGLTVDSALILRNTEKGILLRDTVNRKIVFLTWQQIRNVSSYKELKKEESRICLWFNIYCKLEEAPSREDSNSAPGTPSSSYDHDEGSFSG